MQADASVEMEQRYFVHASLDYVFLLQEVQERKKFEFVETLLSYMYDWLTFYHQGHEVFNDCNPYMRDLQVRVQRTRENFLATRQESVTLKNKMLEKSMDPGNMDKMYTRQGYLFLMEKKAFGTTWTKHYCLYQKENRVFTMIPYNQIQHKITSTETIVLKSCIRRMSDSIDKRFCFDVTAQDKPGVQYTLQALSEEDRKHWMDAMDGKEPMYAHPSGQPGSQEETCLDDIGLSFLSKAISMLESRGLEDQGLYRLVGVASKVSKLLALGLDHRKAEKLVLDDPAEWEVKTITSAIKQYFRNLPEPLMTYKLHSAFIAAAKQDRLFQRVNEIHVLTHKLPKTNFIVLKTLIQHLANVSSKSEKNLMTVSNLGVCFGPTLLRPEEETVAAIMDIKFCNIVVEILIEYFDKIFNNVPEPVVDVGCRSDPSGPHRQITPKSSPPPSLHNQPSSASQSVNHNSASTKHPPVLQKVVTSFTTSEPQTVHFGAPGVPAHMQRSDAHSNLKTTGAGAALGSRALTSSVYVNVPPPPSATHSWSSTQSISSLNSGLNSGHNSHSSLVSMSSIVGGSIGMSGYYEGLPNNRPARPPAPTNGQARGGGALSFVNPLSDRSDGVQSTSSSSESLSSRSSRELTQPPSNSLSSSPQTSKRFPAHVMAPHQMGANGPHRDVRVQQSNYYTYNNSSARLGTAYPPTYRQHMETLCKRQSLEYLYSSMNSISGSQSTTSLLATTGSSSPPNSTSNGTASSPPSRRVRTLYACVGENESELSFEPNQILCNVRPSREPGWLEGTLNGKTGLVPENYVEAIEDKPPPPRLISQRNTDV